MNKVIVDKAISGLDPAGRKGQTVLALPTINLIGRITKKRRTVIKNDN